MKAERLLLRTGQYLVGRACHQLPHDIREQRYQEWVAELPVILHDPQVGPAPRRVARMLGYAADTLRGAAVTHVRAAPPRRTAGFCVWLAADLALLTWWIVGIAGAPGDPLSYLRLAWGVLVAAFPLSMLLCSAWRVRMLVACGGVLAGGVVNLWDAARLPADWVWVNYSAAALQFLLLAIGILVWIYSRRARTRRARR